MAATEADLARVTAELPLSEELLTWYRSAAPIAEAYIPQLGNDLRIEGLRNLVDAQLGYRWEGLPETKRRDRVTDWPDHWVVIADEGADPLIADTTSPGTAVLKDMHGMGRWSPCLLAPALASYLEAQARWIEVCLIQSSAITSSWRVQPWDDNGRLVPEVERRLRTALSDILPKSCLASWL